MRQIDFIILHCTATQPTAEVENIRKYWKEKLGWKNPGYHYLIDANGTIHILTPIENISNGVAGHNHNSINISYIGGINTQGKPKDTRTEMQKISQEKIVKDLLRKFPNAKVAGHYQFANKACPSFNIIDQSKDWNIPISNIFNQ